MNLHVKAWAHPRIAEKGLAPLLLPMEILHQHPAPVLALPGLSGCSGTHWFNPLIWQKNNLEERNQLSQGLRSMKGGAQEWIGAVENSGREHWVRIGTWGFPSLVRAAGSIRLEHGTTQHDFGKFFYQNPSGWTCNNILSHVENR